VIDAYRLVSRNPDVNMWSRLDAALPGIKAEFAQPIDCATSDIALNRNSTQGLSREVFGISLRAGDQVLITLGLPSGSAAIRRLFRAAVAEEQMGFLAVLAGWGTIEVGRQPPAPAPPAPAQPPRLSIRKPSPPSVGSPRI
jgi:hypothetical protein